jgi:hypothetical protein
MNQLSRKVIDLTNHSQYWEICSNQRRVIRNFLPCLYRERKSAAVALVNSSRKSPVVLNLPQEAPTAVMLIGGL